MAFADADEKLQFQALLEDALTCLAKGETLAARKLVAKVVHDSVEHGKEIPLEVEELLALSMATELVAETEKKST